MQIQPYLFFNGRCEEAIELYQRTLDANVNMLLRHRDSPDPAPPGLLPESFDDKVMHASLNIGGAQLLMSDGSSNGGPAFNDFFVSLMVCDEADARRKFDALAADGQVRMPMGRTFWSSCFGMLTDRFGLGWMIQVESPEHMAMHNNPVCWFEIYVEDMGRARTFYEGLLGASLQRLDSAPLEMWSFPMEPSGTGPGSGGALVKMDGVNAGGNSTLVYFLCADCADQESRVAPLGGHVVKPKMSIGQYGYIALVTDTEGNMIGLYSRA